MPTVDFGVLRRFEPPSSGFVPVLAGALLDFLPDFKKSAGFFILFSNCFQLPFPDFLTPACRSGSCSNRPAFFVSGEPQMRIPY